jgi:hypothetical protein
MYCSITAPPHNSPLRTAASLHRHKTHHYVLQHHRTTTQLTITYCSITAPPHNSPLRTAASLNRHKTHHHNSKTSQAWVDPSNDIHTIE